jgi:hypothetical protein
MKLSIEAIRIHGFIVRFRLLEAWGMVSVLEAMLKEELEKNG